MSDYRYGYPDAPQPQTMQPTELGPSEFQLCCDQCTEVFELGEPAIELFYGKVGRGEKSGRLMVVESALIDYPIVSLHEWCVAAFAKAFIYDDGVEEEPHFCAGCEAKLSGDG